MTEYQNTIDELISIGEIAPGDKYAYCTFDAEQVNKGAVVEVITSKYDYVMVANDKQVKLLDVDIKTGKYVGTKTVFDRDKLVYEKKNKNAIYASRGIMGGHHVMIKAKYMNFLHTYTIPKKHRGFEQREQMQELYDFIKEVYNTQFKTLKAQYKD